MNLVSPPLRGLIWKETRQVLPLIWMLLGLAGFLVVLWASRDDRASAVLGRYIPLFLPGLFAAGVGAILVGQEKETRTMLWCVSLPIPPRKIFFVKLLVAITGLLIMWLASLFMGLVLDAVSQDRASWSEHDQEAGFVHAAYWLLHSLFILCCGFYTSWRLKNTFASLIVMIPLAVLPFIAVEVYENVILDTRLSNYQSLCVRLFATTLGIPVLAWLGYRAAMRSMSPERSENMSSERSELEATGPATGPATWWAAWRPETSVAIPDQPFRYPLSSLVWQSIHHNRWSLIALAVTMLTGACMLGWIADERWFNDWESAPVFAIIFAAIATSWLGVFVFNGDGSATRLRFLADRGVSPTRVWIGRQIIGVSLVSLASIVFLLASCETLRGLNAETWVAGYGRVAAPSLLTIASLTWVIYVVSQWTSQVIRILAASAFVAPIVSGVAVYWLVFTGLEYDTPLWLTLACTLIPVIATWLMMRRFMDDNLKWPIWLTGVVSAALFFVVPIIPFRIDVASVPGITAAAEAELIVASQQTEKSQFSQSMISSGSALDGLEHRYGITPEEVAELVKQQQFLPADYLAIGDVTDNNDVPLRADLQILSNSIMYADYYKFLALNDLANETATESLGKWIEALTTIAIRLRLSDRWYDQDVADVVEMWLVDTLSREGLRPLLTRDVAQRAIRVVADQERRNAARQRAIAMSWARERDNMNAVDERRNLDGWGGFRSYEWFMWYSNAKRQAITARLYDRLAITGLRLIDAAARDENTSSSLAELELIRRELHALMEFPEIPYEVSVYGNQAEVENEIGAAALGYNLTRYPAMYWYQSWESNAVDLQQFLEQ